MVAKLRASAAIEKVKKETRQILTFLLDGQDYGLELTKVQEIRGFSPVTPIPNMPVYIKGILNLRGFVLPVVDMRVKFGMKFSPYTKFTVIIIAYSCGRSVGLIVDSVSDVLSAAEENIQPPPDFGQASDTRFVHGLLQSGEHMVVLLDLDRLLTESELSIK